MSILLQIRNIIMDFAKSKSSPIFMSQSQRQICMPNTQVWADIKGLESRQINPQKIDELEDHNSIQIDVSTVNISTKQYAIYVQICHDDSLFLLYQKVRGEILKNLVNLPCERSIIITVVEILRDGLSKVLTKTESAVNLRRHRSISITFIGGSFTLLFSPSLNLPNIQPLSQFRFIDGNSFGIIRVLFDSQTNCEMYSIKVKLYDSSGAYLKLFNNSETHKILSPFSIEKCSTFMCKLYKEQINIDVSISGLINGRRSLLCKRKGKLFLGEVIHIKSKNGLIGISTKQFDSDNPDCTLPRLWNILKGDENLDQAIDLIYDFPLSTSILMSAPTNGRMESLLSRWVDGLPDPMFDLLAKSIKEWSKHKGIIAKSDQFISTIKRCKKSAFKLVQTFTKMESSFNTKTISEIVAITIPLCSYDELNVFLSSDYTLCALRTGPFSNDINSVPPIFEAITQQITKNDTIIDSLIELYEKCFSQSDSSSFEEVLFIIPTVLCCSNPSAKKLVYLITSNICSESLSMFIQRFNVHTMDLFIECCTTIDYDDNVEWALSILNITSDFRILKSIIEKGVISGETLDAISEMIDDVVMSEQLPGVLYLTMKIALAIPEIFQKASAVVMRIILSSDDNARLKVGFECASIHLIEEYGYDEINRLFSALSSFSFQVFKNNNIRKASITDISLAASKSLVQEYVKVQKATNNFEKVNTMAALIDKVSNDVKIILLLKISNINKSMGFASAYEECMKDIKKISSDSYFYSDLKNLKKGNISGAVKMLVTIPSIKYSYVADDTEETRKSIMREYKMDSIEVDCFEIQKNDEQKIQFQQLQMIGKSLVIDRTAPTGSVLRQKVSFNNQIRYVPLVKVEISEPKCTSEYESFLRKLQELPDVLSHIENNDLKLNIIEETVLPHHRTSLQDAILKFNNMKLDVKKSFEDAESSIIPTLFQMHNSNNPRIEAVIREICAAADLIE